MVTETHPPQAHLQLKLFFSIKDQTHFQLQKKSFIRQQKYRPLINNITTLDNGKNTYIAQYITLNIELPHRDAVRFHRTKLRIRVLCIDRHGHMTSCLVPIKSTWSHFVTLQGHKTRAFENHSISCDLDLMDVKPLLGSPCLSSTGVILYYSPPETGMS